MGERPRLNADFRDMLLALNQAEVEYLVVGAHAMAVHGIPRATGDIDIFVRPTPENAERVMNALASFGAPTAAHGVSARDFSSPGVVYQLGLPPGRIDLLTRISGVDFEEAWQSREHTTADGIPVAVPSRAVLLRNKRAAGRPKDLADAIALEGEGLPASEVQGD